MIVQIEVFSRVKASCCVYFVSRYLGLSAELGIEGDNGLGQDGIVQVLSFWKYFSYFQLDFLAGFVYNGVRVFVEFVTRLNCDLQVSQL